MEYWLVWGNILNLSLPASFADASQTLRSECDVTPELLKQTLSMRKHKHLHSGSNGERMCLVCQDEKESEEVMKLKVRFCAEQRRRLRIESRDGIRKQTVRVTLRNHHHQEFHNCKVRMWATLFVWLFVPACFRLHLQHRWPQREGGHVRWDYSPQKGKRVTEFMLYIQLVRELTLCVQEKTHW